MYLKNIILFFCVATAFMQCQGTEPTEEQIEMIRDIISSEMGFYSINYPGLKRIHNAVATRLGIQKELTSSKLFSYTLDDVLKVVEGALMNLDDDLTKKRIPQLYKQYKEENVELNFESLEKLLHDIKAENQNFDENFPEAVIEGLKNRMFGRTEVQKIIMENLFKEKV